MTSSSAVSGAQSTKTDVPDRNVPPVALKYLARHAFAVGPQLEPLDYRATAWELIWVVQGDAVRRQGDSVERIRPFSVYLNPPDERVRMIPLSDAPLVLGVVNLFSLGYDDPPAARHLERDDVVIALLEHALWLDAERPEGWEAALDRSIAHALWVFVTGASGHIGTQDTEFSAPITRVFALLRSIWEFGPLRAPSLDELAEASGVTRVHLCRLFDAEIGHGPVATIRLIRIHDAATLLRSGVGIRETARRTGFATDQHFSQVFRSIVGMTPTEFRADPEARSELPRTVQRFRSHLFRPRLPS